MVDHRVNGNGSVMNLAKDVRVEEDEEEFRSCCEDENELREREELVVLDSEARIIDEHSVKMYFKGVSVAGPGDSGSGFSGIGVVMKRSASVSPIQVQKMLDFYVEEPVANYLALMDGLAEARQNNIKKVYAFTDSPILFEQVVQGEELEDSLFMALKQRVAEHTSGFEEFTLQIVPSNSLQAAVGLARVAVGVISEGNDSTQCCSICCKEKFSSMMMKIKCSHTFCSHCMKKYVECKLESTQVPIRCPQLKCKYYLSATECKAFLPVTSYTSMEKALADTKMVTSDNIYCPYPNCSVLLDPHECSSAMESSSSSSENCCVECPVCQRFICVDCGAPWHSSTTCEENQSLQVEDRDLTDVNRNDLAQNRRQRQCQQCGRMIKLSHGSYHLTCRCGHEFCYSCGGDYIDGEQSCQCIYWGEHYSESLLIQPSQEYEQWAWDSFDSLPLLMDAYSDQERSQLALIQRFLAGGFGFSDPNHDQSPTHHTTDTYADTIKDLHQLPWLERFVSVISDNFYEEYIQ